MLLKESIYSKSYPFSRNYITGQTSYTHLTEYVLSISFQGWGAIDKTLKFNCADMLVSQRKLRAEMVNAHSAELGAAEEKVLLKFLFLRLCSLHVYCCIGIGHANGATTFKAPKKLEGS